jgi:hypothetical protein
VVGQGEGLAAQVGWAYLLLRVIHSLVQALGNKVILRFTIFALSSFALMTLVALAAVAVFRA